ncbi:MAG: hypothetical protein IME97_07955 [Proteobacteria bacterium]|nr:hypothetical protein [Pseudomonadota bacterium]
MVSPDCYGNVSGKKDNDINWTVEIEGKVRCKGRTGVEMEALAVVSIGSMAVHDMCKAVDKDIQINNIRLLQNTEGKGDPYMRQTI